MIPLLLTVSLFLAALCSLRSLISHSLLRIFLSPLLIYLSRLLRCRLLLPRTIALLLIILCLLRTTGLLIAAALLLSALLRLIVHRLRRTAGLLVTIRLLLAILL